MRLLIKLAMLFAIMSIIFSCNTQKKVDSNKPIIYVSISPQKYFVENIAGDVFEVKSLLPPGASPATFEPSPIQLRELSSAKAYLRIGHIGFEKAWMDRIQNTNHLMKVYDQSKGVDFIEASHSHEYNSDSYDHHHGHSHHGVDPHIWTSTSQMHTQVDNIKNMLTELMPDSAAYFTENYKKLKVLIVDTDKKLVALFDSVDKNTFMIYHPALSYFARDYGLEQLPLEFEGKEPSGKYMMELIDKSKNMGISTIFIQKQFPDDKARAIAKELNAEIVKLDPLAYNWPNNMIYMAEQIQKTLVE